MRNPLTLRPLRSLLSHAGAASVALLTLALTIGLSTGVFSIVNGIVFRPLPFAQPDRLIALCEVERGQRSDWCGASVPDAYEVAARSQAVAVTGVARSWPFLMRTDAGAVGVSGGLATPEAFGALGVAPVAGRFIERDDVGDNWRRVVVLSNEIWTSRFGARADVIGTTITLDDESHTIIGILPPNVRVPQLENVEMWRPVHVDATNEERRDWRGFLVFARLADGASIEQAQTEVSAIASSMQRDHFPTKPGWTISVRRWHDIIVGPVRRAMFILLGAVGFLLLIGCANVANLLLAQASARQREMAVRSALGAKRSALVRSMMLDSLVLAVLGAGGGLAVAWAAIRAFVLLVPRGIPRVDQVTLDVRVLMFAIGVSLLTTLLVGIAPALRATRVDLRNMLAEGGRTGTSRRANRVGALLIVAEIALAVVLVTGAGLLGRSFATMLDWQPGFEQEHLLTAWTFTSPGKFERGDQIAALIARAETELEAIPSVVSVGSGSAGPLFGGDGEMTFRIDGRPAPTDGRRQVALWYDISPGYFGTFGVPITRGRNIGDQDVFSGPKVAVVNEQFARTYLEDRPLGRRIFMDVYEAEFEVVGVVADVPPVRPGDAIPAQIFWSNRQVPRPATYFIIRTAGPPASVAKVIADRLHAVDADMQVSQVRTMREVLARELVRPRFAMAVIGTFGILALVLAAIGTYGLLAYSVERRTSEFGIRLALGARPATIVGEVVGRGLRLASLAAGLGIIGALVLTRLLTTLLAGVKPNDPLTYVVSVAVLLLVAALASLIPAARASRVDPIVALRSE